MSLTEAEHLFAGLHESGVNGLLQAYTTARPQVLNYRSSPAVGDPAPAWTPIPPITFPGVPGGIDFAVQFDPPVVDFHPDSTGGMPRPLVLGPGEFSLRTKVLLSVLCGSRRRPQQDDNHGGTVRRTGLEVWGIGRVTRPTGPGSGVIGFELREIELVDVAPEDLESVLECLIAAMLRGLLSTIAIPFAGIPVAGAFSLLLLRGPEVGIDELRLYGEPV